MRTYYTDEEERRLTGLLKAKKYRGLDPRGLLKERIVERDNCTREVEKHLGRDPTSIVMDFLPSELDLGFLEISKFTAGREERKAVEEMLDGRRGGWRIIEERFEQARTMMYEMGFEEREARDLAPLFLWEPSVLKSSDRGGLGRVRVRLLSALKLRKITEEG
jgi:hypothetical protein